MEGCMAGLCVYVCVCGVCVCVMLGDRGAPCLFHWLAPVTSHQQHTKPPEDPSLSLSPPHRSDSSPRARRRLFCIIGLPPILIFPALCLSNTHIISISLSLSIYCHPFISLQHRYFFLRCTIIKCL